MSKRRNYSSNTPSINFVVFLNHNYAKVVRPLADIFFVGGHTNLTNNKYYTPFHRFRFSFVYPNIKTFKIIFYLHIGNISIIIC